LADPGYHDAVRKLKTFGAPVVLVHLPNKAEILTGRPFRGRDAEAIWGQLEKDLGTRIVTLGRARIARRRHRRSTCNPTTRTRISTASAFTVNMWPRSSSPTSNGADVEHGS
jgi:hypothetical protein